MLRKTLLRGHVLKAASGTQEGFAWNTVNSTTFSTTVNNTLATNQMYTSSTYTEYYLNVYNNCELCSGSSVQFSIQYGNLNGSGSNLINSAVTNTSGAFTPSRVVYGEYRNLVYGTENANFSFNSSQTASAIFVINVARSRYKESLLPGSLSLTLASGSNSIKLIDDSATTNLTRFVGENRVYYLLQSGSSSPYYGMMLPDLDIIILNATAGTSGSLTGYIPVLTSATSSIASGSYNTTKLYASIYVRHFVGFHPLTYLLYV